MTKFLLLYISEINYNESDVQNKFFNAYQKNGCFFFCNRLKIFLNGNKEKKKKTT